MSETMEPFVFGATAEEDEELRRQEEERARRAALSALEEIRVPPPPQLSTQADALPPPPRAPIDAPGLRPQVEGTYRAQDRADRRVIADAPRAQAMGDAYRQQRGASTPDEVVAQVPGARIVNDPRTGQPQQVIYPPGVMPLPNHEQRTNADLFGDAPEAMSRAGAAAYGALPSWLEEPEGGAERSLMSIDPNAEVHGMASDSDPVLPGRVRVPDPDAEIYGEASDSDPVLPGHIRPGGADPNAEIYGEASDSDPVLPGRLRSQASEPGDPGGPPPQDRRAQALALARQKTSAAPDYTGADVSDAIRRPLHNLANAFRALGGRPANREFRSERQALEQRYARDRAASEAQLRQQRSDAQQEREMGLRERQLESVDTDRQERNSRLRAQAGALARYRTESSQIARMRAEGAISEDQAQAAEANARRTLLEAQADPESDVSARARDRFGREVQMREQSTGTQLDVNAEGLAADDVEAMESTVRQMPRPRRGSGGGGGGYGQSPEARAALETPPAGWTGTPEQWRALPTRERQRRIAQLGTRAPDRYSEEGTEILPGVFSPLHLERAEVVGLRNGIAQAGSQSANLRGLGQVHEDFGGMSARISPEARARITPRLTTARGMVAVLGNTGVINPSEVPAINAALPNPADLEQMTFGTFNSRLQTWQAQLEEGIRSQLAARGVNDDGIARVIASVRAGSWSQGEAQQRRQRAQSQADDGARGAQRGDVFFVYGGRRRRVRADRVEEAREALRSAGTEFTEEPAR